MTGAARAEPFPWDGVLHAGLGLLRLPPDAFWRMTPRELSAALGWVGAPHGACDRAAFEALARRFPDAP
ncbi:MAG: rcc01693 family protein [Pseudomonadota bacterium]